jgi:Carbohydrate-selective porin, OprB family
MNKQSELIYGAQVALCLLAVLAIPSQAIAQSQPTPDLSTIAAPDPLTQPIEPDVPNAEPAASPVQVAAGGVDPSSTQISSLNRINDRYQCGIAPIRQEISRSDLLKNMDICLTTLELKMAQNMTTISPEDIAELKNLSQTFREELSDIDNRINTIDNRISIAQNASTFSTTTKLNGEVIAGATTYSGASPNASNTVFSNRVRLNFDTTFTGQDRLRTRLQARNTPNLNAVTGTNMTRLGFDGGEGNQSLVSLLQYTLPVFERSRLIIETTGSEFNENMYTFNPLLTSSGSGSISRFGRYNPVYRQSNDGAAITLDHRFDNAWTGSIGYAIPGAFGATASNPASGSGIDGSNALIAQVRYQPTSDVNFGLTYARSYHSAGAGVSGGTGSAQADLPFGANPVTADHFNFLATARISPGFVLSGWAGMTYAQRLNGPGGTADIYNFAVSAAFPDLGAQGNVLGLIVGMPPKLTGGSIPANTGTSLHLEALYKMRMSENLDLTPGVLLITNPDHNNTRPSEFVGTVRATFKF